MEGAHVVDLGVSTASGLNDGEDDWLGATRPTFAQKENSIPVPFSAFLWDILMAKKKQNPRYPSHILRWIHPHQRIICAIYIPKILLYLLNTTDICPLIPPCHHHQLSLCQNLPALHHLNRIKISKIFVAQLATDNL
ncbi:hypothetical protein HPP92_015000 [Vanilla planifolia]|uniref:Uncharacterized protein n=1 Tax=Vanilla planifolia TaxID=51239 RepID=A0A835UTN2_VANPL|nr:hypothetical protein HPP92_015000 [Vanilla planifolia]